jgi:hypothetical protein
VVRLDGRSAPTRALHSPVRAAGTGQPEPNAPPDTKSELRAWIKENAALLSNARLMSRLAAIALNLLPNAGVLARSFGILALIAVLLISELLLLIVWKIICQGDLSFQVWVDERGQFSRMP